MADGPAQLQKESILFDAGGVFLRGLIAVVSLIVIGSAIVFVLVFIQQKQHNDHRKAIAISEYGLMKAFEMLAQNSSWKATLDTVPYDGGCYIVTTSWKSLPGKRHLIIESRGMKGSSSNVSRATLQLKVEGNDTVWVRDKLN